jgi:hypothetical protein
MKPTSLAASFLTFLLLSCASAKPGQESKPTQSEKARPAPQAEKKPSIVLFQLAGKPTPAQKPERPKSLPRFEPLSAAEKLKTVSAVMGLPNLSGTLPTPYLTLTPSHREDPLGNLTLGWPKIVYTFPLARFTGLDDPTGRCDECGIVSVNQEYVEVDFPADAGKVYMVDFFIAVDLGPADFQLTVSGTTPSQQPANAGGNHLLTPPIFVGTSGWYSAILQLKPRNDTRPYPNWSAWYFLAAELSKFVNQ